MKPRIVIVVVLALSSIFLSCSRTVQLQPDEYDDPGRATLYRIVTVDEQTYAASEYTATDTSIVVTTFYTKHDPDADHPPTPFVIPMNRVARVEKEVPHRDRVALMILAATAVVILIALNTPRFAP